MSDDEWTLITKANNSLKHTTTKEKIYKIPTLLKGVCYVLKFEKITNKSLCFIHSHWLLFAMPLKAQ